LRSTAVVGVTGVAVAQVCEIFRLKSVGIERRQLHIVAYDLPPNLGFECLLGLDFFRGHRLCVEASAGILDVEAAAAG
jgi:hypothetical protein